MFNIIKTQSHICTPNSNRGNTAIRKKRTIMTPEAVDILRNLPAEGKAAKNIASAFSISVRSARRWISHVENDRDVFKSTIGRPKTDRARIRSEIESIVASDCSLTAKGMIERLPEDMGCSSSTIRRELSAMNYTRKRLKPIVQERNSSRVIAERHRYAVRFSGIRDEDLVFIDETGFNLHVNPEYGYAPEGVVAKGWCRTRERQGGL